MILLSEKNKSLRYILIIITGILFVLFSDYLGFFEVFNNYLYDLSFRIRGTVKHDESILIAAIDEKTLGTLGRWPLNRLHYARLVDAVNEANVIGFDIIFSEPSPEDTPFSEAISRHGKVVLPVYIGEQHTVSYPTEAFSKAWKGHIHLEPGTDGIVRKIFHRLTARDKAMPSFASVIYDLSRGRNPGLPALTNSLTAKEENKILQSEPMHINFYGTSGTFRHISFADIIEGKYAKAFFKNKIVLTGLTASGFEDRMIIPFTEQRNTVPGVEIHANVLNNLLDGKSVRIMDGRPTWVLCLFLCFILYMIFMRTGERVSALLWFLVLCSISVTAFLSIVTFNLWIQPAVYLTSASWVFAITYLYRLDAAARKLDMKYLALNEKLKQDTASQPEKTSAAGLASFLSPKGINTKIYRLLAAESQYEATLENTVKQRTEELSKALSMINTMSNEMITRLAKATESKEYGTGEHIMRIGAYAKKIAEHLGMPGDFVELLAFASPMHDLGKIGIPDSVLLKKGCLTPEEFNIMKEHTVIGEKILYGSSYPKIRLSASIALNHHERWDGTGYPRGLKGSQIPVEARIVMICDIYDAMRSLRPYKPPLDHNTTLKIIAEGDSRIRPHHFEPDILKAFFALAPVFESIYETSGDITPGA